MANAPGRRPSPLTVVAAGLATTALALVGVWWLDANTTGFHVMGWYADYVIPAGAALVGMAAGAGYGIASWMTGLKIQRRLLLTVLALQLAAYATAEVVEYRSVMAQLSAEARQEPGGVSPADRVSFFEYFHVKTMSFAWEDHGEAGKPIGAWGYLFVGLAIAGFAGGGMLVPAMLFRRPYCDACTLYMRSREVGVIPESLPARELKRKDPAVQAAQAAVVEQAAARLRRVTELASIRDGFTLRAELAPLAAERRATNKLPARLSLRLFYCRGCKAAFLQPTRMVGQGERIRTQRLAPIQAGPEIVYAFIEEQPR